MTKQPFTKDTLQNALHRAGATPRDFAKVLPCHTTTFYTFLRTGKCRDMQRFAYEQIYEFLFAAQAKGIFPIGGGSENKKATIKRAYDYWSNNDNSLDGFVIRMSEAQAT